MLPVACARHLCALLAPLAAAAALAQAATESRPAAAANAASAPAPAAPAAAASAPTAAPPPEAAGQQVEIVGGRESDTDLRRQSTTAKIVIGREEIDKFGDATVGEVLRRLPGVTAPGPPGRSGPPRLRGLGGGLTQLLIDGQRIPPGFSLESLTSEQIERIEILRAPTAETGARAIAGTINIITREGFSRRINDLRISAGHENGEFSPGMTWTHNDSSGPLTYNLSAGAFRNERLSTGSNETTEVDLASGEPVGLENTTSQTQQTRRGLNLGGRLQWRLSDAGDLLTLMPSVFHSDNRTQSRSTLTQTLPPPPELPASTGPTAPAKAASRVPGSARSGGSGCPAARGWKSTAAWAAGVRTM